MVLGFASLLFVWPMSALGTEIRTGNSPGSLTLNAAAPHTVGPLGASAPCIIAGTNCQQPFAYTNYTQYGHLSSYDVLSPVYSVSQLPFSQFNVAIDVNTSNLGETLLSFEVRDLTTNTVLYSWTGSAVIGLVSDNGSGYGDWTLSSIDLSHVASNHEIQFHAIWSNASNDTTSFFLVGTNAVVPEPTSLLLLGAGLSGLALAARRKRKS